MKVTTITSAIAHSVYLLTTDLNRANELWRKARRYGMDITPLFPKELPVPEDAGALIVDLDYLCMDLHVQRRWAYEQLKHPLHPILVVVARNLPDFLVTMLRADGIHCVETLNPQALARLEWTIRHDTQRERQVA